jgi:hypothetical protein
MNMLRILILLALMGCVVGCNRENPARPPDVAVERTYAAISAALGYGRNAEPDSVLLLESTIASPADLQMIRTSRPRMREAMPALLDQTVDSLLTNMKVELLDASSFPPRPHVSLFTSAELSDLFVDGPIEGWWRFYQRYPRFSGYYLSTTVGFAADGTQALVYTGHYFGSLGAEGVVSLLSRHGDAWIVDDTFTLWVS